jgi:hypothetical protein
MSDILVEDNLVIIEVRGGVAECTQKPDNITVHIIDWDSDSEDTY